MYLSWKETQNTLCVALFSIFSPSFHPLLCFFSGSRSTITMYCINCSMLIYKKKKKKTRKKLYFILPSDTLITLSLFFRKNKKKLFCHLYFVIKKFEVKQKSLLLILLLC